MSYTLQPICDQHNTVPADLIPHACDPHITTLIKSFQSIISAKPFDPSGRQHSILVSSFTAQFAKSDPAISITHVCTELGVISLSPQQMRE